MVDRSGPLGRLGGSGCGSKTRGAREMDLIERWFHVSPDGGSGLLEAFYAVAAFLAVRALAFHVRSVRRRRAPS